MNNLYILDEQGRAVLEHDMKTWAMWFETADRLIARTDVGDVVRISTVFLGIDHNFLHKGPPVLWETMTFGYGDQQQQRYTSREAALAGHEAMVRRVRNELEN